MQFLNAQSKPHLLERLQSSVIQKIQLEPAGEIVCTLNEYYLPTPRKFVAAPESNNSTFQLPAQIGIGEDGKQSTLTSPGDLDHLIVYSLKKERWEQIAFSQIVSYDDCPEYNTTNPANKIFDAPAGRRKETRSNNRPDRRDRDKLQPEVSTDITGPIESTKKHNAPKVILENIILSGIAILVFFIWVYFLYSHINI